MKIEVLIIVNIESFMYYSVYIICQAFVLQHVTAVNTHDAAHVCTYVFSKEACSDRINTRPT